MAKASNLGRAAKSGWNTKSAQISVNKAERVAKAGLKQKKAGNAKGAVKMGRAAEGLNQRSVTQLGKAAKSFPNKGRGAGTAFKAGSGARRAAPFAATGGAAAGGGAAAANKRKNKRG